MKGFYLFFAALISLTAFGTVKPTTKPKPHLKEVSIKLKKLLLKAEKKSFLAGSKTIVTFEYRWYLYSDGCFHLTRVWDYGEIFYTEIVYPWEWAGSVSHCMYEDVMDDMC